MDQQQQQATNQVKTAKAADDSDKEPITDPRPEDILCGKEKHCVSHQGSLHFRVVIDQYAAKYAEAVTKQEKMNVTKEIYDMLGGQNARFLKCNATSKNVWEELSSLLARDKISHALRFANREKKAATASSDSTEKPKSSKRGHRRTGSDDSNSTLTTAATELSLDEFENLMMDGEPLEWQTESSTVANNNNNSEPRPYVYEVPYESAPPAPYPYYHHPPHAYSHHSPRHYYYSHPHPQPYHYGPPAPPAAAQQAMAFPEKPLPAPPARESSMDVDLTYMLSEPLMDWDLETDEVLLVS